MVNSKRKSAEKLAGTETLETAMKNGSEAFKTGFDKVAKSYDHFFTYGRDTAEACVKSANAAGKGAEAIQNEIYAFSKQSLEESVSAAKALFGTRSIHEAFELQSDFVRSAFDSYVGGVARLNELVFSTAKDAIGPLQGRMHAWVEAVESTRAV